MRDPAPSSATALIEAMDRMIEQLPRVPETSAEETQRLWTLGEQALLDGRFEDAMNAYETLVQSRPSEAAYQFGFALAIQQLGHVELAGRHFSYAYALDPSDAACAYRLGECLAALGYTVDAPDALLAAQQLCDLPKNPPEIRARAESLMRELQ